MNERVRRRRTYHFTECTTSARFSMAWYVFGVDLSMHISIKRAIRLTRRFARATTNERELVVSRFCSTTTRSERALRDLQAGVKLRDALRSVGDWLSLRASRRRRHLCALASPQRVSSTPSTGRRLALHPVLAFPPAVATTVDYTDLPLVLRIPTPRPCTWRVALEGVWPTSSIFFQELYHKRTNKFLTLLLFTTIRLVFKQKNLPI